MPKLEEAANRKVLFDFLEPHTALHHLVLKLVQEQDYEGLREVSKTLEAYLNERKSIPDKNYVAEFRTQLLQAYKMITDNLSRIFAGKEGYEEDVLKRLKEIDENPYVGCEKEISKLLAKRLVQYMKDNNSDKSIECKNTVYWMAQRLRGKPEFENTRGLLENLSDIFTDLSLWIK